MVKVSVIMSSYNHEKFVADAIVSVINQTFADWEFVIVDDGSKDKTPEIIEEYSKQDERIKFTPFANNKGACIAIENCIRQAQGEYVAMINSDDIWELNKLEKQVKYLDEHDEIGAVFSKVQTINEQNENINHSFMNMFNEHQNRSRYEWLNRFFFKGNCLCHPSMLIRKKCYEDCGGVYKKELAGLPDFDMWVRLCMKYDIHIMNDKFVKFRLLDNDQNESANTIVNTVRHNNENCRVLRTYLNISSSSEFSEIFPEAPKFKKDELIPFYLAMQFLEVQSNSHKMLGLSILYDLFSSDEKAKVIEKECNFTYADLHRLSKQIDVFNIEKLHAVNPLVTRRYFKYFEQLTCFLDKYLLRK